MSAVPKTGKFEILFNQSSPKWNEDLTMNLDLIEDPLNSDNKKNCQYTSQ